MERFPDGAHVRLRSRWHDAYLYADEDGFGVSLKQRRESLNAAWAVHRVVRGGTSYLLLHSAAYGRYLAFIPWLVPRRRRRQGVRRVCRVVQRAYATPEQDDVLWEAILERDGTGDVLMRHRRHGVWRGTDDPNTMMSWMVEAIPPRQCPPEPAFPAPAIFVRGMRAVQQPVSQRRIQYARANHQWNLNQLVWTTLLFDGRSLFDLRSVLANQLGETYLGITLCVRAGSQGRLTPLVIDLPDDNRDMEIVVFATESEAAAALVYPNVTAR